MADGVWPEVRIGDCREVLKTLPAESVHCVVTSPPYWNLRCYGWEDQIGLEPTFAEHREVLVEVFRRVRRVLRADGCCFINYGDAYACSPNGRKAKDIMNDDRTFRDKPANSVGNGFKPKDLMLMPHRLAIALQDDGWWIRSEVVWSKLNPLPESVTDRFTRSHEFVFMLTKSPRYYFDQEAVREPHAEVSIDRDRYSRGDRYAQVADSKGYRGPFGGKEGKHLHPKGRNRRSVWNLATQPLPFEHYAAFPEALVEPLILCSTSESGCCPECGAGWRRTTNKEVVQTGPQFNGKSRVTLQGGDKVRASLNLQTTGWVPGCACGHPQEQNVPATVLDIFAGSGTTLRVATKLGRRSIGIELNEYYVTDILSKRTAQGGLGI